MNFFKFSRNGFLSYSSADYLRSTHDTRCVFPLSLLSNCPQHMGDFLRLPFFVVCFYYCAQDIYFLCCSFSTFFYEIKNIFLLSLPVVSLKFPRNYSILVVGKKQQQRMKKREAATTTTAAVLFDLYRKN